MILSSILALLVASALELGGSVGIGRLFGEPDAAEGRATSVADPVRGLWSGAAWLGYQWRPGHLLALRFDQSRGSGRLAGQEDLGEDLEETLLVQVYGLEYVSIRPSGWGRIRIGGGLGYAKASDRLETRSTTVEATGDGMAAWGRSGLEIPFARSFRWHLDAVGQWSSFASMKARSLEPYKTGFPILRLETGLSLSL